MAGYPDDGHDGSASPVHLDNTAYGGCALSCCCRAFAGIAQVLQTEAFASAQVSAIGPFAYSGLLWAALIGWFGFQEIPGLAMLAGGLLIIGSGVWMLRGERPSKAPVATEDVLTTVDEARS